MTDFYNLCRACLASMESIEYYLFDNVPPDVYLFCTSTEVKRDDPLSKAICNACHDELLKFFEFKKKCIESYKTLLNKTETNITNIEIDTEIAPLDNNFHVKEESEETDIFSTEQTEIDNNITLKDDLDDDRCYDDVLDNVAVIFADPLEHSDQNKTQEISKRTKIKLKKDTLKCDICNQKFTSAKRLLRHKLGHQNNKRPYCTPCDKKFATWCGLRRHEAAWHMRVRLASISCGACGKVALSRDSLRAHRRLHEQRTAHVCSVCGNKYSSSVGLKAHAEIHKENRERQCTCEYCGKKFFTKKTLSSHVTRCHTGRRFICQICNYPFTDKYNLSQHLLIHEGKKKYTCNVCGKMFATRFTFEEHQRIHSGERPFSCVYCPKSFLSKKRLTEHHRIHTGEKPHKCTVCTRAFTQRGTLNRHMKVHEKFPTS